MGSCCDGICYNPPYGYNAYGNTTYGGAYGVAPTGVPIGAAVGPGTTTYTTTTFGAVPY
jgi:hypothetical protein